MWRRPNAALGVAMMRLGKLIAVLLLLVASETQAEGWADITGKNSRGDSISLVPTFVDKPGGAASTEPFSSFSIYVTPAGASIEDFRLFEREPCVLSIDPTSGAPMFFGCSELAKSPLKGARYIAEPNPDPDDCAYSFKFACVQGCQDAEVPKTLERGFWECGPSE